MLCTPCAHDDDPQFGAAHQWRPGACMHEMPQRAAGTYIRSMMIAPARDRDLLVRSLALTGLWSSPLIGPAPHGTGMQLVRVRVRHTGMVARASHDWAVRCSCCGSYGCCFYTVSMWDGILAATVSSCRSATKSRSFKSRQVGGLTAPPSADHYE
jgi:hypothetical protein